MRARARAPSQRPSAAPCLPRLSGPRSRPVPRARSCLLFGATMAEGSGGETHFPHLSLKVKPRLGDALVWANVDGEGNPNPRSLHEGRPPSSGEKLAVNVWVADKAFDLRQGMERAVVT